ncbi:translation initiation factor IF-3 [Planoprotostelium fungivorum]|uniref:Translation initiation factor IF-3 n=1 Tax=Planoprotostelium fungivorum TaxID=1890364 RepID=A0A2P6N3R3_9EUKA|nr:translation initiation factor IF-3 [Planoprotostelium fungivorum]
MNCSLLLSRSFQQIGQHQLCHGVKPVQTMLLMQISKTSLLAHPSRMFSQSQRVMLQDRGRSGQSQKKRPSPPGATGMTQQQRNQADAAIANQKKGMIEVWVPKKDITGRKTIGGSYMVSTFLGFTSPVQWVYHRINEQIEAPRVYLQLPGQPRQEIRTVEAMKMARDQGLDLIEVSRAEGQSRFASTVCKIDKYSKYLFDMQKAKSQTVIQQKLKEVIIGTKIADNDLETKVNQSIRMLERGNLVRVIIQFAKGEQGDDEFARGILDTIFGAVSEVGKWKDEPYYKMLPRPNGDLAVATLSPLKKIKRTKSKPLPSASEEQEQPEVEGEEAMNARDKKRLERLSQKHTVDGQGVQLVSPEIRGKHSKKALEKSIARRRGQNKEKPSMEDNYEEPRDYSD